MPSMQPAPAASSGTPSHTHHTQQPQENGCVPTCCCSVRTLTRCCSVCALRPPDHAANMPQALSRQLLVLSILALALSSAAGGAGILGLGPSAGPRRDPRSQMMAQPPAPPSNPPPALQPRQPLQQPQAQDLSFAGDMDGLDDGPPDFLQEPAALPDAQSMSEAEAAEFARQLAASGLNPDTLAGVLAGLT